MFLCKLGTSAAFLCKHSDVTPLNLRASLQINSKSSKGKTVSKRFQSYQMQRRAAAAVSCHGLDHAGSLRKAAGSGGGGRMGAVCCAAAPSVEAPPRGSIQPFAFCGSCTQACYLYGHHRRRAGSTLQSPSCIPRCQVGAT